MLRVAAELALRQLIHRGGKLLGALIGVCVAIVLIFTQLGFQNALYDSAVGIPRALDADILIAGPTFKSWADIAALTDQLALPDRLVMDRQSRVDFEAIRDAVVQQGQTEITVLNATDTLQRLGWVTGLFDLGPSFAIDGTMITSDLNYYRLTSIPLDRAGVGVVRVEDGQAVQAVRERVAVTLGPGQYFGERALMTGEARNATVVGRGDGRLAVLSKQEFQQALNLAPDLPEQLTRIYFGR